MLHLPSLLPSTPLPRVCPAPALAGLACLLLSGALLAPGISAAQTLWKWRDATGRVVVSDLPPPRETPAKDILQQPASAAPRKADAPGTAIAGAPVTAAAPTPLPNASSPSPTPVAAAKPGVDPELEKRRKAAELAQAAQAKADEARLADQRRENCSRARGHLAGLESGQRMARMNEKGEREILDDRARADEIRRAREVIAADCR
jgi:flagellar biosynthesis/type III secretory pathway protein FliH